MVGSTLIVHVSWQTHKLASRAAWAAAQFDEAGKLLAAGQGTVSAIHPQTAVEGEHHGLLHGAGGAAWGTGLQSDCASAVAHSRNPYAAAVGAHRRYAGHRRARVVAVGSRGQGTTSPKSKHIGVKK